MSRQLELSSSHGLLERTTVCSGETRVHKTSLRQNDGPRECSLLNTRCSYVKVCGCEEQETVKNAKKQRGKTGEREQENVVDTGSGNRPSQHVPGL